MNKGQKLIAYAASRWQLSKLCARAGVPPHRVYNARRGSVELNQNERAALVAVMQLDGQEARKFI